MTSPVLPTSPVKLRDGIVMEAVFGCTLKKGYLSRREYRQQCSEAKVYGKERIHSWIGETERSPFRAQGQKKTFPGSKKGMFAETHLDQTRIAKEHCALDLTANTELLRAKAMSMWNPGSYYTRMKHFFYILGISGFI